MAPRLLFVAVLAGCAHAFRAPSAKRSPAALRSMDEDDGSWPSDSSDESVIDVVGAAVEDVDALKRSLLLAVSRTARGQQLDKSLNDDVAAVARSLEGQGGAPAADALTGRWSLAYCSTYLFRSSPFWMAGRAACEDGQEAKRYDWFCDQHRKATMVSEIGAVRQIISEDRLVSEFETSVAGFPMRVGGSMPVNIFGSIVSSADVVSAEAGARGLDMTLEMADVEVKGSNIPLLRTALDAGLKLDSRAVNDALPIDRPFPVFTTTYCDDEVRVSRDVDDNLYIYTKESDDPTPTSYDDVPADLGIPELLSGVVSVLGGDL
mmetsp:Transcript_4766/g.14142  ORF Transcript_4766/g.14142 Transcript_4766/m.14142 type:complete len:320 (+) Transcript_4766:157-1116(+)